MLIIELSNANIASLLNPFAGAILNANQPKAINIELINCHG
ncbi:MAG: hypothetical protein PT939_06785 [Aerococcus suis]|nr:hypothetical protein [Aerococcus suis]